MGFRAKSILISTLICSPIYAFLVYRISKIFRISFVMEMSFVMRPVFYLFSGLTLAFVFSLLILLFNTKSRVQAQIQTEYEKNGYSDRYVELLQKEVNRLSAKGDMSQIYLNYIRSLANAYLFQHNNTAAIETINLIRPDVMIQKLNKNPMGNLYILNYFDVQMAICESLHDTNRAEAVMRDAYPYLQANYGKGMSQDIVIDEFYITYYCLFQNYEQAFVYAGHCLNRGENRMFGLYGNLMYSKVFINMNDYKNAEEYMKRAESFAKTTNEKRIIDMEKAELEKKRSGLI